MRINLGYCCVSMLHKELQCSRSSTKTYLMKHSKETCHSYLLEKANRNLMDLTKLLHYNYEEGIYAYRMPEQILPQLDLGYYKSSELSDKLIEVGTVANQYQMQLSTHPSQYFVLNSTREEVVERTLKSINLIAETMELMNLNKTPNLTLHLGMKKGYDSVDEAIRIFCKNYLRLGTAARNYLVLENDHVSFTIEDCMKVHKLTGIPIVFDNKHYEWNPGSISYEEALTKAMKTWGSRTPKLHLSSDRESNKHAHADYIKMEDYLTMVHAIQTTKLTECYIMLECKQKDAAVVELMKQRNHCS